MSAGCMRLVLNQAVRNAWCVSPGSRTPVLRFLKSSGRSSVNAAYWKCSAYSTVEDDQEVTPAPKRKKKENDGVDFMIGSVGRKIPQKNIELLNESGESLGTMHRVGVIKMMDNQGLKLVLINADKEPPVYQLMTGKQIHMEQLKLREKQKAKPAVVQVKELVFSTGIASHDLTTKLNQVESWLKKKHHVRITLRSGRNESAVNLDATLEQMVQQTKVLLGFVSVPKVIRDGRAAMCVVRPPSAKEIAKQGKKSAASDSAASGAKTKTNPVSTTNTTDESIQQ